MKKLVLSFLVVPFLLPLRAIGQNDNHGTSATAKSITISGRVSEDGKIVLAKNGESWMVTNPEALAGHESHQVKLKGQKVTADHRIQVLSVRSVATPAYYRVNLSDSAFRR